MNFCHPSQLPGSDTEEQACLETKNLEMGNEEEECLSMVEAEECADLENTSSVWELAWEV